jgi:DNA gyrase subunit A
MRKFRLTEVQATAILDMQLRRLAAMERSKLKKEKVELEKRIRYLEALLGSEAKQLAVIAEETADIKAKYATPRKTTIVDAAPGENGAALTCADLATPDHPQMVVVTTKGILRGDASDYSYRVKAGASSRAVTAHRMRVHAEPTDRVCLVTTFGRAWIAPVGQVPEEETCTKMGLGREEQILYLGTPDPDQYLVLGTAQGKVKRMSLSVLNEELLDGVWEGIIGLSDGDRVAFAGACDETGEVLFYTDSRVLRTSAENVSEQKTLTALGVVGIKLGKDDTLVGGSVLADPAKCQVLVLSEKGYIKRLPLQKFTLQGRGGKGMQSLRITGSTGPVVAAEAGRVSTRRTSFASSTVDVLAEDGKRQRIAVKSIPQARTRQSRGKKLVQIGPVSEIVLL